MRRIRAELGLGAPGYIESWGRGIEKIRQECLGHGIEPPLYDFGMAGLMLTFHANPEHLPESDKGDGWGEKWGETLTDTRRKIVEAMIRNSRITSTQLMAELELGSTAIEKNLKYLKDNGFIARIGPAKGGHWEIIK